MLMADVYDQVKSHFRNMEGVTVDPGTGKPMKDRVLFPAKDKQHWIRYCEESVAYFRSR